MAAGVVLRRYRFLDGGFIDGTIVIVSTAASAVTITSWLFVLRAFGW